MMLTIHSLKNILSSFVTYDFSRIQVAIKTTRLISSFRNSNETVGILRNIAD